MGIGLNTAPSQKLHVVGNAQIGTAGEEVRLGYMGYNDWSGISHKNRASVGNYALMQNSSGRTLINASTGQAIQFNINNAAGAMLDQYSNFGIGTTSPDQRLDVKGNAYIGQSGQELRIGNVGVLYSAGIAHKNAPTTTGYAVATSSNGTTSINSSENLTFRIANAAKMVLDDNDGRLGIGTIAPAAKLHVVGNARITSMAAGTSAHQVVVVDGNGELKKIAQSSVGGGGADGDAWGVNGEDETSWVARTGNVGVGLNTAPSQKLHVAGNAQIGTAGEEVRIGYVGLNNFAGFAHNSSATSGGYALGATSLGTTVINAASNQNVLFRINNQTKMILDYDGNFGINVTGPSRRLHVNGDARITNMPTGTSSDMVVVVNTAGDLRKVAQSSIGGGASASPIKAYGKVSATGTGSGLSGATVTKTATGEYRVAFTQAAANANYVIQLTQRSQNAAGSNGNDAPSITYYDQQTTFFRVRITDNDNGATSGRKVDGEFMFTVLEYPNP